MPELLSRAFASSQTTSPAEVLIRLVAALILGVVVSAVYRASRGAGGTTLSFQTTLVLLTVLITMVTEVIGDNIARAFSLVGALSIVRFRTAVRDTQDTAYVMFSVAVGMALGAANLWVAAVGIAVVSTAAALMVARKRAFMAFSPEYLLSVTTSLDTDPETILPACDQHANGRYLRSLSTTKQGGSVRAIYGLHIRSGGSAIELVRALNRLDGVQNVELQRPDTRDD